MNWIGGPVLSSKWWCTATHRHSSTDTTVTFWKIQWKPNFAPVETQYTYGRLCMYVYTTQVSWNSNPNTMKHDQAQHDCIHHLCCHPAVFLCWLHLSTLSIPKVKIQWTAKMLLLQFFHFVQNCAGLKLHNLILRRLMSYIYGAPILDVSRSHTTTQHSR